MHKTKKSGPNHISSMFYGLVKLIANNTAGDKDLVRKLAKLQRSYDKLKSKEKL